MATRSISVVDKSGISSLLIYQHTSGGSENDASSGMLDHQYPSITLGRKIMLIARQHSVLPGFLYDLFDSGHTNVGTLSWPDIAIAQNARLKNPAPGLLSSTIEIKYGGQQFQIAFEYLTRDWFNSIRFTLLLEGTVLASADVISPKKLFRRPTITLTEPFEGQVIRKSGLFSVRFEVVKERVTLGSISEKGGLTVNRELSIDLPNSISAPVQIFIFFLVHNQAYR